MDQLQRERQILNETKRILQKNGDPDVEKLFKPGFWYAGVFTNIRYSRLNSSRIQVEYIYNFEKYSAVLSIDSILSQLNTSNQCKTIHKTEKAPRFTNSLDL